MKQLTAALLLLLIFSMGVFISCKHEVPIGITPAPITPGGGTGGGTGGAGTGSTLVCFETDVLPIFQTNCAKATCHDAASHQKGHVLDSYAHIVADGITPGNASHSKIYKVLFENGDDRMPRAPNPELTTAQKALIGRWINEGAQNTTHCSDGSAGCDTTLFKFTNDIKPILANNCIGCHSGAAPPLGINLTTYDGVRQVALSGRLLGAITHSPGYQPMPQNANKLSDCKIIQIKKWITAGAPNN
jgi:hypothetical protein